MTLKTRFTAAAATIKAALFQRTSTNPNTDSSKNYLDLMYERDYREVRRYKEWREMMQDPQVKVGLSILQMFLLSRELHVTPQGDEEVDKKAAKFIEDELKVMRTSLRQLRKNMYTAVQYGFSANEVVYQLREDGLIGLRGIYPIHRRTLDHVDAFTFDDLGELVALNQQDGILTEQIPIPIEKVLLYSFDMEFDDPHGQSILDEIYDNTYIKDKILKWLAIFLQKHEAPFLVGKIGPGGNKDKMRENMEEVADGRTQMTIGKDDEVEIKESSHHGEAFFESLKYHDAVIFRRMFIGTLMMGQIDTSGSYAQSESQLSVTRMLLDGIHEEMAGAIQKTTDRLCKWNYTAVQPPKISFEKFEDKDILRLLEALKPYADSALLELNTGWFGEIMSMAIKELSGLEVDKNKVMATFDDELTGETGDITPIPGSENSPLNNSLSGLFPEGRVKQPEEL